MSYSVESGTELLRASPPRHLMYISCLPVLDFCLLLLDVSLHEDECILVKLSRELSQEK